MDNTAGTVRNHEQIRTVLSVMPQQIGAVGQETRTTVDRQNRGQQPSYPPNVPQKYLRAVVRNGQHLKGIRYVTASRSDAWKHLN
jgi:hypothetical protein